MHVTREDTMFNMPQNMVDQETRLIPAVLNQDHRIVSHKMLEPFLITSHYNHMIAIVKR